MPIDKSRTRRDYDDIRWYVMHEGISVFVEEGDWYVQMQTRCKNLGTDNLCNIYEARPEICREYEPGHCDYSGGDYGYDLLLSHQKQVEEYYYKKTGKRLGEPRQPRERPAAARRRRKNNERQEG